MAPRRPLRAITVTAATLVASACAVGPDFERPAAPDVSGYTSAPLLQQTASSDVQSGETQRFVQGLDIPGQWWTLFHSPPLSTLVEEALKNNPTLPAAEAALRQAWENVYAAEGAFFPTAVASYSPSSNKTATGVTFTAASSGPPFFTLHTAQSAEAQLHSASASIGVAVAARLPQFTLTANAGTTANQISQLFMTPGTAFWTVAGNVAQTVFDAGTLLHKQRAAEAAFDQAAAMYRSTVIAAFQNVADSLHALQSDAETLKAAYAAERAASKSLEIARRQLPLGAIGYLGLLTAENTYNTALLALVQAQAARYADTAALFQALGGGWWNRQDVAPAKADLQLVP